METFVIDATAQNYIFLIASVATVFYSTWLVSEADRQSRKRLNQRTRRVTL
jgi:membrane protein implicated in regulation of membrane protease activity